MRMTAERLYPSTARRELWNRRFAHVELLVALLLFTGGRSEEVRGLQWEEIDWHRNEVIFCHNRWRKLKRRHCVRRVPMTSELRRLLREFQNGREDQSGLILVGAEGGMTGGLQTIFSRCVMRAGLSRDLSPHSCRHTFATAMLNTYIATGKGVFARRSSFDVAKLVGHRDSRLVDTTYGHLRWDAGAMEEFSTDALRRHPTAAREAEPWMQAGSSS